MLIELLHVSLIAACLVASVFYGRYMAKVFQGQKNIPLFRQNFLLEIHDFFRAIVELQPDLIVFYIPSGYYPNHKSLLFKRSDFGMTWGLDLPGGGPVGDDVDVTLYIEGVKPGQDGKG